MAKYVVVLETERGERVVEVLSPLVAAMEAKVVLAKPCEPQVLTGLQALLAVAEVRPSS